MQAKLYLHTYLKKENYNRSIEPVHRDQNDVDCHSMLETNGKKCKFRFVITMF